MSLTEALQITKDWDANFYEGRPKTWQVHIAEKVVSERNYTSISDKFRFKRKIRLQFHKFEKIASDFENDSDFTDAEKIELLTKVNELKEFFLKFKPSKR